MIRVALIAFALASPSVAQLARIDGRVFDASGSQGVAARIAVAEVGRATILFPNPAEMLVITPGESGEIRKRCSREVVAGADGRFTIPDLQPGRYALVAAHAERGIAIRELAVNADALNATEITLEAPRYLDVWVKGLAFDSSKHVLELKPATPLGNVNVVPRLVQNGWNFRAGPLPAIDSWLVVGTEVVLEHDYRAMLFEGTTIASQTQHGFTTCIDLDDGKRVDGCVRGSGGEPLGGVSVVARCALPGGWARGTVTDTSGNFSLLVSTPALYEGA